MTRITVPLSDGTTRTINGYATGDRRFLITRDRDRWTVTHRATGARLCAGFSGTRSGARDAWETLVAGFPGGPDAVDSFAQGDREAEESARSFVRELQGEPVAPLAVPMRDMLREALDAFGGQDWDGDEDVLVCPCGYTLEQDAAACPNGCVNPLRAAGLI